MPRIKKPRGRPPRPMPERIDASPEEILDAMLAMPPDHQWQYPEKEQPEDKSS